MPRSLADLTDDLLHQARRAGAGAADAIAVEGRSILIGVLNGALEQAERSEGVEIGLRVMVGARQACVSASDITPGTMADMAERAVAMARLAPEDPTIGLADPAQLATGWDAGALDLIDGRPHPDPATLEQVALRAEAAAMAVPGVSQVQVATAGFSTHRMHLAASNGFSGGYGRTGHGLSCVAITGAGTAMERDYDADGRTHAEDMAPPETIGRTAGERAVQRAGAQKPPTGAWPVLYDERTAAALIGHMLQACNGSAIVRGSSWLRDALGAQVLPRGLSITEDPHRPRTSGARPFDAEGLPTARRMIVKDGVLTGWTLDLATGRKLNMPSTASATRGTGAPPSPSVSTIALTEGDKGRDALLAEMGTGLLITSLMGASINPTTGDYSRGASGFWVRNGQIAHAVNECTVAGNLRQMLMTVTPANDARRHLARVVPSLLVECLTIAGA
ncbi:MAG: TldD/PmbA family protein [Rhodobacteraceae bacterium]|nr:TldD/PmbA family protein [Paracoccaceae bacterium]